VVLRDVRMGVGVGFLDAVDEFVPWGESRPRDVLNFGGQGSAEKGRLSLGGGREVFDDPVDVFL
jgi:hypothetical protein